MSVPIEVQRLASDAPLEVSNLDLDVLGVGCRTAVGLSAPATMAAVRAGIAGFRQHPYLVDRRGEPLIAAAIGDDGEASSLDDRLIKHAGAAVLEALEAARRCVGGHLPSIHLALALPESRPDIPGRLGSSFAARLRDFVAAHAILESVVIFPAGHAAGLVALAWCARRLTDHPSAVCVLGGVDSYIDADSLDWLEAEELLKHPGNPWGFIPGEAAAFAVIAGRRGARATDETVAGVRSVAVATEPYPRQSDGVCTGRGLSVAARLALQHESARVDYAICDLNGESYRADEFGFTIVRIAPSFVSGVEFETPADAIGDVGAASAPLFIAMAQRRPRHTPVPQHVLLTTSSEGGTRAAAVVRTA